MNITASIQSAECNNNHQFKMFLLLLEFINKVSDVSSYSLTIASIISSHITTESSTRLSIHA